MPRYKAALQGAREVSFTVLSMSVSLIAVFVPILLMGGLVGRLFREFAMTITIAIVILAMPISFSAWRKLGLTSFAPICRTPIG